ncbi:MAG: hypothetical protein PHE27_03710 [Alphaproteobacteria bacterium]|nr:hypothetical protein [Alphaproteobacteria bacterium]
MTTGKNFLRRLTGKKIESASCEISAPAEKKALPEKKNPTLFFPHWVQNLGGPDDFPVCHISGSDLCFEDSGLSAKETCEEIEKIFSFLWMSDSAGIFEIGRGLILQSMYDNRKDMVCVSHTTAFFPDGCLHSKDCDEPVRATFYIIQSQAANEQKLAQRMIQKMLNYRLSIYAEETEMKEAVLEKKKPAGSRRIYPLGWLGLDQPMLIFLDYSMFQKTVALFGFAENPPVHDPEPEAAEPDMSAAGKQPLRRNFDL